MKIFRAAALACLLIVAASCAKTAEIRGVISGAENDNVIVKLLNINSYNVLDTVKTDKEGNFTYKVEIEEGNPEFVYLFHNDTKVASLLLENGDKVAVSADTLGNYSVEGSEASSKLQEVENNFAAFAKEFAGLSERFDDESLNDAERSALQKELSRVYLKYYRNVTAYVLSNSHSLTCVPVFFQVVNANFPIFSQQTDAILFRNVCDSLKTVYPDSRYVKALDKEASRREEILGLSNKLNNAKEAGFLDLEMPDVNGQKIALSSVGAKVIMVHFWSASDAVQKMFNLETIKPLYDDFHDKGFEVYSVCVDTDKALWASVVKNQELPWINVCDGLGAASRSILLYGVTSVPLSFLIVDGDLTDETITGASGLRRLLQQKLK